MGGRGGRGILIPSMTVDPRGEESASAREKKGRI